MHTTLSIESTCDDTSLAIVTQDDGVFHVHMMLTRHQWSHERYGGVVPEAASREHATMLPKMISSLGLMQDEGSLLIPFPINDSLWLLKQQADLEVSKTYWTWKGESLKIDSICVAAEPWLPWSIVTWVTAAHMLGALYEIPVYEVNHIMGHVFSPLLEQDLRNITFPYLCLTVSGGHSDVYLVTRTKEEKNHWSWTDDFPSETSWHKRGHVELGKTITVWTLEAIKLCQTSDDAVWEAFDKVAKLLWWPYPGGKWIDDLAKSWKHSDELAKHLRKIVDKPQFSFSWVKAQMVALLKHLEASGRELDQQLICDIAWMFQERVIQSLITKLSLMIQEHQPETVWIVWGVSANSLLKSKAYSMLETWAIKRLVFPTRLTYCMDNAAMIAVPALLEQLTSP